MNANAAPLVGKSVPGVEPDFRQKMEAWRQMLAQCARKPVRKSVHGLRVATLRLQSAVEFWLGEQHADEPGSRAARRWKRRAKKLRRALGPVRQEDVSLAKLKSLRAWTDPVDDGHPVFPRESLGTLDEMERSAKRRRAMAARKLAAEIERRGKRLIRLSQKVESAMGSFALPAKSGTTDRITVWIAALAADFPVLNADNLHDFRKRIKKIRYLAEIFASSDAEVARQAASLKRMMGALGEWHDWQVLAQQASDSARSDAATYLHDQANRSLAQALKLCRHSIAQLLNEGSMQQAPPADPRDQTLPPRKPVVRVSNGLNRARTERSGQAS
jgi:CHAD domain-containing protein